jgi:endoglucanase
VLGLSFLFYEAQRSGKLGPKNRIAWRGDSGLLDRAPDGRDVTGGWYDAGDNVKFNLPMAWTSAVLAWSVYEFKAGYQAAGQYLTALDNIKWVTDYFIKCVGDGSEIVGQVGNGGQDHGVWGRPEDKTAPNPVYTLTKDRPGSDVVGAMAAALASASVVFEPVDPAYSAKLLAAALKAYDFASKHIGSYNNAIPDAANFYRSSNLYDDLAWAAVWLHVRTGKPEYKKAARELYDKHWKTEDGKGVWNNFGAHRPGGWVFF